LIDICHSRVVKKNFKALLHKLLKRTDEIRFPSCRSSFMLEPSRPFLQEVRLMSARVRLVSHQPLYRRLMITGAVCAAWFLSTASAHAQSGMCASGGTGITAGTGSTGSIGGTTTTGATAASRTGTAGAAGTAASAMNLLNMAAQFQQMQAQAEHAQALYMMQALYLEEQMFRLEQQQIAEQRQVRLARSQKRRAIQAAKIEQRRNGKANSRPETLSTRRPVSVAFGDL
jgi:hypothetical protein